MTQRALLAALAASLATSIAPRRLEASEGDVSVVLHAPKVCPTREVLFRDAQARVPSLRLSDGAAAVSVRVRIIEKPRGFGATIEMERSGTIERRSLVADTCAELVEASGLLIALFVNPDTHASATASEESGEDGSATASASATASVTPAATAPAKDAADPSRVVADAPSGKPSPAPPRPYVVFAGANIQSEAATFPALALGVGVFVGLERSSGILAPALRLEAALASSDLVAGPERQGSVVRGTLRADGCPVRLAFGAHASLRPCVWVGAGVVRAAGLAVEKARADIEAWVDVGARLRGRLEANHFFAELEGGAVVPLTRPTIVTQNPTAVVHETPLLGALFSIGGGYRFF